MLQTTIFALFMLILISAPLIAIYRRVRKGKYSKKPLIANICTFFGMTGIAAVLLFTQGAVAADAVGGLPASGGFADGMRYIAAALAVGLSGIGGGIAVSASAAAALGAISENEGTFGKALIFVGMAEGVALYGLLIAFLIMFS